MQGISAWEHATGPLLRKLDNLFTLTSEERCAVLGLPAHVSDLDAHQNIVHEGDDPSRVCFMLQGVACTYKHTESGKRQIVNFHIAGDAAGLHSLYLSVLDMSIRTITPCKIGLVPNRAIRELCARFPRIAGALWRETMVNSAIYGEWITNLGHRPAKTRIAHLLSEWVYRSRAVGLADNYTIPLPITQNEIADAMGLSTVHVNRSLQALRGAKLVSITSGTLRVLDWDALRRAGDFDPTYLHDQVDAEIWNAPARTGATRFELKSQGMIDLQGTKIGNGPGLESG
jgi:CRP-like cAMP-binding protein